MREIHTRLHVGKLFRIPRSNYYRFVQDPIYRAMLEWNVQTVPIRNATSKKSFNVALRRNLYNLYNPFAKIL